MKIPLDSPLWAELKTFYKSGSEVPARIREALTAPADEDSLALHELTMMIFHQYSTADATFAAFPYLLEIFTASEERNATVLFLAANIAGAIHSTDITESKECNRGWAATADALERLAVKRITRPATSPWDPFLACKAALAFLGHPTRALWMDIIEPDTDPESTNRTTVTCPGCNAETQFRFFENGAVPTGKNYRADPPESARPWSHPPHHDMSHRDANPWAAVELFLREKLHDQTLSHDERVYAEAAIRLCNAGVVPSSPMTDVFALIGTIFFAHGYTPSAKRFWRLLDTVTCPMCKTSFIAADAWWGVTYDSAHRLR